MTTVPEATGCSDNITSGAAQPDRREVRIHCRITVEFRYGNLNDYGICWNLGAHGMYIAHEGEVIQGEPIDISFLISDEYPLLVEATGKVAWVNSGCMHTVSHFPEGFGVEFVEISDESVSVIQKLISDR